MHASLFGASLKKANLHGAVLTEADLTDAVLTDADIILLSRSNVKGFITDSGGKTSHISRGDMVVTHTATLVPLNHQALNRPPTVRHK